MLWGTGSPKREFVFVDDILDAYILLLTSRLTNDILPINIGVGSDISKKFLAEKINKIVGYSGAIVWDKSKPDVVSRKLLDNSKITSLGWKLEMQLDSGLKHTYQWYLDNIK